MNNLCNCEYRNALLLCLGVLALGLAFGCAPEVTPTPLTWPSVVVTEDRQAFYVSGLQIPGTRQELRLRDGDANLWLPLPLVQSLQFTGPAKEGYRPAKIVLTTGGSLQMEVFVNHLLEGRTDLGYWNMPFSQVSRLEMGTE